MGSEGFTGALAEFTCQGVLNVDSELDDVVKSSLLDTIGVCAAATNEPSVRILRDVIPASAGRSTVVHTRERRSAEFAALLNGTTAHALDYDDVGMTTHAHPSAVLWPTILAVGQEIGASGVAMRDAYIIGHDVQAAVATAMDVREHYARGWHTTSTIGTFGTVAAASRLLGLTVAQTRYAFGLTGSVVAGSRQNFGTMTKPLHAGLAARDGVLLGRLASSGFTADPEQLEAPLGFLAMYSDAPDPGRGEDHLRGRSDLAINRLNVKKYPFCYGATRTAEAAFDLVRMHDLRADEIVDVSAVASPGGYESLNHHLPQKGLEGKFSAEYVIAAIVIDRELKLKSFEDDQVRRPGVQDLMGRIRVREERTPPVGDPEYGRGYAVVTVRTVRGTFERRIDSVPGDRQNPLTRDELLDKIRDCFDYGDWSIDVDALAQEVFTLDKVAAFEGFTSLLAEQQV